MLRNGLTFPVLADALRQLFIDVATNEILTEPKARTDSRISLLTGVHRKEIRRLRALPADAQDTPEVVTLVGQIIARWVGTSPFLDDNGRPRPLPRTQTAGSDGPTFDTLVESVTTDIRSRAVLEELLGHGIVTLDSEERVQLDTAAFIPRPGGEEQLFYFARNLHDHIAAAVANIGAASGAPFLDRSVHYDRLTEEQAQALLDFARAAAVRALLEVNRRAVTLVEDSESSKEPSSAAQQRVNFGIYIFEETERPAAGGEP